MNKLLEFYMNTECVPFDEIPKEWVESFTNFMFGQAGPIIDGRHCAYSHDYKRWFNLNKEQILRDIKLEDILNKKSPL
jgi:hypothetical protein